MVKNSFSLFDFDDDFVGVDAWEDSGILAAAEASEAHDKMKEVEMKLESEKSKHELLAESAKERLKEMSSLLEKVELSTVTKKEMKRIAKLDEEMKLLNRDLTASKSALASHHEERVKSTLKTKTYEVMKTAKSHDIKSVIRFVKDAETVDLAFLLDCTNSMGNYIEGAKASMKNVVRHVKRTNQGLKLRVAVVGYRDLADTNRFEVLDFTSSLENFENFVGGLIASGGADTPEDVAGAVQKANSLTWSQTSRITFLVSDAPCHGLSFHSCDDNYPGGTPGICIENELKTLVGKGAEAGMQLYFGRITSLCDKMIDVLNDKGFKFEVCDFQDTSKITSAVSSSVRKSISKSVTASMSNSKSKTGCSFAFNNKEEETTAKYTIREAKPSENEWESLNIQTVGILCNKPIDAVADLKAPLRFGVLRWGKALSSEIEDNKMQFMRRSKNPFAEGQMRLAYYSQVGKDKNTLLSDGSGDRILKSFKKNCKNASPHENRQRYLAQMEVSSISYFLAEEYNKTCRPSHCPEICFLKVVVVEDNGTGECFCAEDQLPCAATAFTKYSNNTGYWNEDEISQSLLLFTRFTHKKTGGYMMVTDLQGVRHGNKYILTDPAILCKDTTRFGETNLGEKLIDKCMASTGAMLEEYGWEE